MEGKILECRMVFLSTGKALIDITLHLFLTALTMKQLKSTQVNIYKDDAFEESTKNLSFSHHMV